MDLRFSRCHPWPVPERRGLFPSRSCPCWVRPRQGPAMPPSLAEAGGRPRWPSSEADPAAHPRPGHRPHHGADLRRPLVRKLGALASATTGRPAAEMRSSTRRIRWRSLPAHPPLVRRHDAASNFVPLRWAAQQLASGPMDGRKIRRQEASQLGHCHCRRPVRLSLHCSDFGLNATWAFNEPPPALASAALFVAWNSARHP